MKSFNEYIKEDQGIVNVADNPNDRVHQPDIITPIPNIKTTGHSTSIPMHWGNSRQHSRGALGFGANPRGEDNRVLSYADFMKTTKGFSEKETNKK